MKFKEYLNEEEFFSQLDEGKIQDFIDSSKDKGRGLLQLISGDIEEGLLKLAPQIYIHIMDNHPGCNIKLQAVKEACLTAAKRINPMAVLKEIPSLVKKYGWKLGLVSAGWELFEHFCLPLILSALGLPLSIVISSGTLPIGELFFYPIVYKIMKHMSHMSGVIS